MFSEAAQTMVVKTRLAASENETLEAGLSVCCLNCSYYFHWLDLFDLPHNNEVFFIQGFSVRFIFISSDTHFSTQWWTLIGVDLHLLHYISLCHNLFAKK